MRHVVIAVAALMLGLLPACAQEEVSAQVLIAQAPAATQEEQTARVAMEMVMSGGGQDITITADGGVDFTTQRAAMTMSMGEQMAAAGLGEISMVTDGTIIYMQLPNAEALGVSTPWVKMDTETMPGMGGLGQLQQTGNDPTKSMEMLQGVSDDITEVGEEEIRGEPTTHYTATIDMDKALEQVPEESRSFIQQQIDLLGTSTLPVDVWIDEEGRLRRQRMDIDTTGMAAGSPDAPAQISTTIDMYDFGAEVDTEPPPADQVTDFADVQGLSG
jgi:hypothetical protein